MLEGLQILIDRMEMFPEDFHYDGKLREFLDILGGVEGYSNEGMKKYYESIFTPDEIEAFKAAATKYHRDLFNSRVIKAVMDGEQAKQNRLLREIKQGVRDTSQSILNNTFSNGGSNTVVTTDNTIGAGAFVTKTGALFTPAAPTKKKKSR